MKARLSATLLLLAGLLVSSLNNCPMRGQAASAATMDCCDADIQKGHCPVEPQDESRSFSCCSPQRLTAQSRPTRVDVSVPPPSDVTAAPVAPRGESRRFSDAFVLAAGPPGFTPASLGNRAPPAA